MKKRPNPKKKAKARLPKEDFNQAAFRVVQETDRRASQ
jgi:hypothetical protein